MTIPNEVIISLDALKTDCQDIIESEGKPEYQWDIHCKDNWVNMLDGLNIIQDFHNSLAVQNMKEDFEASIDHHANLLNEPEKLHEKNAQLLINFHRLKNAMDKLMKLTFIRSSLRFELLNAALWFIWEGTAAKEIREILEIEK